MNTYQAMGLFGGLLYVALPITAWTILHHQHDRRSVALWCSGAMLYGLGFMMVGLRDLVPNEVYLAIAGPAAFASYPLRGAALRREAGEPELFRGWWAIWLVGSVAHTGVYYATPSGLPRLLVSVGVHCAGTAWLCHLSWVLYRARGYRSAALLTCTYGAFAAALALRLYMLALHLDHSTSLLATFDFVLMFLAACCAALYGNLGYIGIALEACRIKDLAHTAELAREHERLVQTQLRMHEQAALHQERGDLLARREEMLAALAHEVRQPLNNASAALEGAALSMEGGCDERENASARLQRASSVLMQVTSALDNTLADAALLSGTEPLARHDADVDTLVALAIADIDSQERDRVTCIRATPTRTASMNPGLMRLALRNLISNALAYSPPDTPVVVRIADSDEPLALVIDVCDQGPGVPAALIPKLFDRGVRGDQVRNPLGHGLGLYIVRRVMELHGGDVVAIPQVPHGLVMRLRIPQSLTPITAAAPLDGYGRRDADNLALNT